MNGGYWRVVIYNMDAVGVDRAESADEREMSFAPTEEGMEDWYDSCVCI